MLLEWWSSDRLDVADLRQVIVGVWEMAAFPARALGIGTWVDLFRSAGLINEYGEEVGLPDNPIRAWRGAPWGQRRGMSWTLDLDRAAWFASRSTLWGRPGEVFEVEIPPPAILAFNLGVEGRAEHEVIVDPSELPSIGRSSIVAL